MNWRAALQSADDASDEAIMLGQMAFVLEVITELVSSSKRKNKTLRFTDKC